MTTKNPVRTNAMRLLEYERGQSIEQIISDLFERGLNVEQVAADLRISHVTFYRWMDMLGGELTFSRAVRFSSEEATVGAAG